MTKEKPKFIKMYDPETGEYLGPLVNMTHEEAHGKKPEGTLEIKIDKEAWDKLKYEHDVDGDHVELSIDNDTARQISWHISEVYDNLLKNTNILSKEIEDRVNYETTQHFYLPKFHFKRPE